MYNRTQNIKAGRQNIQIKGPEYRNLWKASAEGKNKTKETERKG